MREFSDTMRGVDANGNPIPAAGDLPTAEQLAAFRAREVAPVAPTAEELAAFRQWQDDQGITPTVDEKPALSLDEGAFTLKVGDVVRTPRGFGLVVAREAVPGGTTANDPQAGYVVADLGQANDSPATLEALGLKAL